MKEHSDSKSEPRDVLHSGKYHSFKKKGKQWKTESSVKEFFEQVAFCTDNEGLELYVKTIDWLWLYVSIQFKNVSDMIKCLKNKG